MVHRFIPVILLVLLIVLAIPTTNGAHVRGNHSYADIGAAHIGLSSTICSTTESTNCYDCLASNNDTSQFGNYTWCTKPEFCFLMDGSNNGNTCLEKCSGGYYHDGESAKCDDSTYTIGAVIVSFVLLVVCPLCLACGCCYVVVVRCRNMVENKVAVDNEIIAFAGSSAPIPLLQVYREGDLAPQQLQAGTDSRYRDSSGVARVAGQEEASFVLAEARVAAEGDSLVPEVGALAAPVRQVPMGNGGRIYSRPPVPRAPASALVTATASSVPMGAPAYAQPSTSTSSRDYGRVAAVGES